MIFNMSGPWGNQGDDNQPKGPSGGKRPQEGDTDVDRIIRENAEQIKKLFGGGNKKGGGRDGGSSSNASFGLLVPVVILAALFWLFQSFHQIESGSQGLKMRFGKYVQTLGEGLNFAPWPIYQIEQVDVDNPRKEMIGIEGGDVSDPFGLMLTADENIVDIRFEVQWTIKDPVAYQFNIAGQKETINALAQSVIREVVAQLPLIPILNTERDNISIQVAQKLQASLDQYQSGIDIRSVNLREAVAPRIRGADGQIKDAAAAFEEVQSAEAQKVNFENQAKADRNRILGQARAQSAEILAAAEGYKAQAINGAEGEASRFVSVLEEYKKAPEVTRRRLYLETMQNIYGNSDKVMMGTSASEGVVPYLPLNELNKSKSNSEAGQ